MGPKSSSSSSQRTLHITTQTFVSTAFVGLGVFTILFPKTLVAKGLRPEARATVAPITYLWVQSFGFQAILTGLALHLGNLTRQSMVTFGAMLVPTLAVDYWYCSVNRLLTTSGTITDVLGKIAIITACFWGSKYTPLTAASDSADTSDTEET